MYSKCIIVIYSVQKVHCTAPTVHETQEVQQDEEHNLLPTTRQSGIVLFGWEKIGPAPKGVVPSGWRKSRSVLVANLLSWTVGEAVGL